MEKLDWRAALAANAVILGVAGYAGWLEANHQAFYYRSVQEDEYLEWATFWAFLLAAVASGLAALRWRRVRGGLPWFLAGVALFCFGVGMEEISWGQRVFAYRPPAYFLENNFQQEFNAHNVVDSDLRKLAFRSVIGGYGIALPLLWLLPPTRRLLERLGADSPTPLLIPAFAAMLWTTMDYPWKFTNEIVELMLGLGFLFPAVARWRELGAAVPPRAMATTVGVVASSVLVFGLGLANANVSRLQRGASGEAHAQAVQEIEAMHRDLLAASEDDDGDTPIHCNVHKRIYSILERYDADFLLEGEFARLVEQGMPEERAEFFIDPWNYAYWIRSSCRGSARWKIFVYSFGPNQRRDSGRWELGGDDIGVVIQSRDDY